MTEHKYKKFVMGVDSGGTHNRNKDFDLSGKCIG